jgi:hypothetical protein
MSHTVLRRLVFSKGKNVTQFLEKNKYGVMPSLANPLLCFTRCVPFPSLSLSPPLFFPVSFSMYLFLLSILSSFIYYCHTLVIRCGV